MGKLLTLTEAGEIANRNLKGVRQLIYRKKFPSMRVGGRVFVDSDELDKFLKLSRTVTAEQAAARQGEA